MKRLFLVFVLISFAASANASVLVFSSNGAFTTETSIDSARSVGYAGNRKVVVTSALSSSFSNISTASVHGWPTDRALHIEKGGSLGNTTTFRINGPFSAGRYQVFTGAGKILFGQGSVQEAFPEWWGFSQTASATVNAAALQAAVDSGAPIVSVPSGTYSFNNTVKITKAVRFDGAGSISPDSSGNWDNSTPTNSTLLSYTGTGPAIVMGYVGTNQSENINLSNFMLLGTSSADGGILVGDGTGLGFVVNSSIRNVAVSGFTKVSGGLGYGVSVARCYLSSFYDLISIHNRYGVVVGANSSQTASTTTTVSFYSLTASKNTVYGVALFDVVASTFFHPKFEGNGASAIQISPTSVFTGYIDFFGVYTEANCAATSANVINIDHTGTNATRNINFFGGDITETLGGNVASVISIKSTEGAGLTDAVTFNNVYLSATTAGYVITDGNAQNSYISTRAGSVADSNITGNTVDSTT